MNNSNALPITPFYFTIEDGMQLFTNQLFGSVRSAIINGEPWFVGIDIAKSLGYMNPPEAIRDHVDDRYKTFSG